MLIVLVVMDFTNAIILQLLYKSMSERSHKLLAIPKTLVATYTSGYNLKAATYSRNELKVLVLFEYNCCLMGIHA